MAVGQTHKIPNLCERQRADKFVNFPALTSQSQCMRPEGANTLVMEPAIYGLTHNYIQSKQKTCFT